MHFQKSNVWITGASGERQVSNLTKLQLSRLAQNLLP
jgi:hypothetical protein